MDEDERWAYSQRLMRRLNTKMVEASPGGVASGLAAVVQSGDMAMANSALEEAFIGWEKGEVEKEELDQKAAGYLKHWREVMKTWKP